jgi:hypothetical protein
LYSFHPFTFHLISFSQPPPSAFQSPSTFTHIRVQTIMSSGPEVFEANQHRTPQHLPSFKVK